MDYRRSCSSDGHNGGAHEGEGEVAVKVCRPWLRCMVGSISLTVVGQRCICKPLL